MVRVVEVPALKPLVYQGRSYVRGEMVTVTPIDALLMARRGDVLLTARARVPRDPDPELEPEPPKRRRRGLYRRRDMVAESSE